MLRDQSFIEGMARRLGVSTHESAFFLAAYQAGDRGGVIAGMFSEAHIAANASAINRYWAQRSALDIEIRAYIGWQPDLLPVPQTPTS